MGNKSKVDVTKMGDYELSVSPSFSISLFNCFYSPYIERKLFHSMNCGMTILLLVLIIMMLVFWFTKIILFVLLMQ